eukprot:sb/3472267/
MHEIIEVPLVLIEVATARIVDIFHEYVKPKMCPQLSPFCKKLTGINQFCNVRRKFCNFYGVKRVNLDLMLKTLGLQAEGTPHSGISDTRNIANIVCTMIGSAPPCQSIGLTQFSLLSNKKQARTVVRACQTPSDNSCAILRYSVPYLPRLVEGNSVELDLGKESPSTKL